MATILKDLIESIEKDDLPTNEFTIEDEDPMVILGKINEVIAHLKDIQSTINDSDSKASQALESSIKALESANTALSSSNVSLETANKAIESANQSLTTANQALQESINAGVNSSSALEKSSQALTISQEASSNASTAIDTASQALTNSQEANTTATNANNTANQALFNSNEASTTATNANSNASQALTNSQQATTDASNALSTASNAEENSLEAIRVAQEALDQITQSLGTKIYVNNTLQNRLDFSSDPQSQLNELRSSVDSNTSNLSQIQSDVEELGNDQNTLANDLTNEITSRTNADSSLQSQINNKVDKETGKGLSSNDFTTAEKEKLAGIESGAQVNPTNYVTTDTEQTINGAKNFTTRPRIESENALNCKDSWELVSSTGINNWDIFIDGLAFKFYEYRIEFDFQRTGDGSAGNLEAYLRQDDTTLNNQHTRWVQFRAKTPNGSSKSADITGWGVSDINSIFIMDPKENYVDYSGYIELRARRESMNYGVLNFKTYCASMQYKYPDLYIGSGSVYDLPTMGPDNSFPDYDGLQILTYGTVVGNLRIYRRRIR